MYTVKQIANVISQHTSLPEPDAEILYLSTDSRRISFSGSVLFFALKTRQRNGHDFIKDCYEHGVRNFVVHASFDFSEYKDANFIIVMDTLDALQQIAAFHRKQFKFPVIGITGSNGKTIVKEWLYQLLHNDFEIIKNPKSYNSQTGVPLSVWMMAARHNLGIFEAGISMPGEMIKLENVIFPTIGVFTNIGHAHDEGFINMQQKVAEKMELFKHASVLIYNADEKLVAQAVSFTFTKQTFTYGTGKNADLVIEKITRTENETLISCLYQNQNIQIKIPFTDEASIQNALTCWSVLLYFKLDNTVIAERMKHLHAVDMRLQLKQAINGCYLINDAYSFDISSLEIALDFLSQQHQTQKKTIILSDLPQANSFQQYEHIAGMLEQKNIDRLILIGHDWEKNLNFFKDRFSFVDHYSSTTEFIESFNQTHFRNETILLKGARAFAFEKIASFFDIKVHQTIMEVHLNAMIHNLNEHRKMLMPSTKIMAMVKAFGYGSGSAEIAGLLQYHKVDYLAVAYADEGVDLRKAGITLPILILNIDAAAFNTIVDYNLEPEIFSFSILNSFTSFLMQQGISNYPVHIKIDTGMHRLGFEEKDLDKLGNILSKNNQLKVKSVFSHLVASEDPHHDAFSNQQFHQFKKSCGKLHQSLQYDFLKHISNSAAIFRKPEMQMDMVRLGIGLYGIGHKKEMQLKPVAVLKTTIAQLRKVNKGETIGYNRQGVLLRDSMIATLRIGYADGYPRALGNGRGKAFVKGKYVPVIGNVCMDMTMIDVTEVLHLKEGDEVELMGEHIPVETIAEACNTIPYEILTGIGQRVKRVYIEE